MAVLSQKLFELFVRFFTDINALARWQKMPWSLIVFAILYGRECRSLYSLTRNGRFVNRFSRATGGQIWRLLLFVVILHLEIKEYWESQKVVARLENSNDSERSAQKLNLVINH